MPKNSVSLEIVSQLFNELSDSDKKAFLKFLKSNDESQKVFNQKTITQCPHCKSKNFTKNGKKNGHQRYICNDCKKTFGCANNTILFNTKKDLRFWVKFIECFIQKYSINKTAKICGITPKTAFLWRHKILDALQYMQNEVKLDGIVEADETFFKLSYKGHHKNFKLPRLAKHRGTPASMRGISKEQVCITCALNLNGLSLAKISNLGKPSLKAIEAVLGSKIEPNSVLVTDNLRSYNKISYEMSLNHIRIPKNKQMLGSFNIQSINSYHSRLKSMLKNAFKGVSTKYLNNYLVYHNFVNIDKDKEQFLFNFI